MNNAPGSGISLMAISTHSELVFINREDLIRVEADGKYTKCVLKDRTILASKNLKEFETVLKEPQFIRVHHSHLVSTKEIQSFKRSDSELIMSNSDSIPVSQRKKDVLTNVIQII